MPIEVHEKGESDRVVEHGLDRYERMFMYIKTDKKHAKRNDRFVIVKL